MIKKLPNKLFEIIKRNSPLSCVDIILINKNKEFLMVKRNIRPYKDKWCLPGGIVKKNQKLNQKIKDISNNELGIDVEVIKKIGFYEKIYSNRHDITHCYLVKTKNVDIKLDFQASDFRFFRNIPKECALFYIQMLEDSGFKSKN